MTNSLITTHVLDVTRGKPARGIPVALEYLMGPDRWTELGKGITDGDGRVNNLLPDRARLSRGLYRLTFQTSSYFQSTGIYSYYPYIPVVFEIQDGVTHHHVPLLVSPFGYSTYKGS